MEKYKVLYRSTGLLSGREPGDTVELDGVDGKHLEGLGIVRKVAAPKAEAPEPKAATTKTAAKK
ncbi:hypothetical protein [Deinococcus sp. S9]|uniref:hypothetical protein n=1 Tax=Deinococcus sp. S9 TaxID=2545754 RepID=UPI0010553684|nr:hypothetical protein [Deinococcus sp. S9]TDE85301.1 hypothetical protein E0686_12255 [Deinococcus sp. S9]